MKQTSDQPERFNDCDNYDDKLFLIMSELELIPLIPHAGIIYNLMDMCVNKVWLESDEFDMKAFFLKIQRHILDTKKILGAKMKGSFKPSLEKMVMGGQCTMTNIPVLNPKNKLFGLLSHFKMLTNTVEKFNAYHNIIQKSTEKVDSSMLKHDIKMYMISWNLAGFKPDLDDPEHCSQLIRDMFETMDDPDMIIVNLQEIIEMKANTDMVLGLFSQDVKNFKVWIQFFQNNFKEAHPHYEFTHYQNLLGLGVFVLIHQRKINDIRLIRNTKIKFGLLGAVPNKGTIMDSFQIHDNIVVFSNSHLPSGEKLEKIKARADKVEEILENCRNQVEFQYDLMFIAGDLNLRCYADFPFETRKLNELELISRDEYIQKCSSYLNADESRLPDTPH